jgi:hypothetical protein
MPLVTRYRECWNHKNDKPDTDRGWIWKAAVLCPTCDRAVRVHVTARYSADALMMLEHLSNYSCVNCTHGHAPKGTTDKQIRPEPRPVAK